MNQPKANHITLKIATPIIIGVVVVFLLFRKDFSAESIAQIHLTTRSWEFLALALVAIAMREGGMAWRFHTIADGRLSISKCISVTFLCEFTSAITPTSVGGSALSMIFLSKEGIRAGNATAMTFTTLMLDMLFFTAVSPLIFLIPESHKVFAFSSPSVEHGLRATFWAAYGLMATWGIILYIGLIIKPKIIRKAIVSLFRQRLLRRWEQKAAGLADGIYESSGELRHKSAGWWAEAVAATILSWSGRFLVVNALFAAFIANSPQLLIFIRQIVVWALLMFTPTPGGSGLSEWLFKTYYGDLIASQPMVMVIALLWRILTYHIYLVAGIFFLPKLFRTNTPVPCKT